MPSLPPAFLAHAPSNALAPVRGRAPRPWPSGGRASAFVAACVACSRTFECARSAARRRLGLALRHCEVGREDGRSPQKDIHSPPTPERIGARPDWPKTRLGQSPGPAPFTIATDSTVIALGEPASRDRPTTAPEH